MYDLAIIGAGWAGFNAALRAKALGLSVCLIDSGPIGGTCLNRGCIPTKTLIASAKVFSLAKRGAGFGVQIDNPHLNWDKIQDKKDKVVHLLAQGMHSRLSGIDLVNSAARIISPQEIKVASRIINAKFILIATGSYPVELPELKFDRQKIISSDEVLKLSEIPTSLLVIGGGVIGCEFAGLFSSLGTQVTIAEKMPQLLPGEDKDVCRKLEIIFKKKGITVHTFADIRNFNLEDYTKVLVCIGRVPNLQGLGLEDLGIKLRNNKIETDDYLKTNIDNIYAAGDCTGQIMLAHYAAYQGELAAGNIAACTCGHPQKSDNRIVPSCIFTDPQIASVGVKENDAFSCSLPFKAQKFDFRASAMAQIIDETEGFIKIIKDQESGRIMGASIIGPQATELISILVLAISQQLSVNQLEAIIFAHPTLAESLREVLKN